MPSNVASLFASISWDALNDPCEDKVKMYANALIHSIYNERLEDTEVHMFLNFLRELSLAHLDLLRRFSKSIPKENSGFIGVRSQHRSVEEFFQDSFFGDFKQRDLMRILMRDLYQKDLIRIDRVDRIGSDHNFTGQLAKQTTSFEDKFLRFISDNS